MYRTRVDSVNGNKIFAGGKWLKCIGNKPVRVGDLVWTDGKCVYGNFLEAGDPFIPVTSSDSEIIPIANVDHFYYFDKKLNELTAFNDLAEDYSNPYLVNSKKKCFIFKEKDIKLETITHGLKRRYSILDADIDNQGNVFKIEDYFLETGGSHVENIFDEVQEEYGGKIYKNDEVFFDFGSKIRELRVKNADDCQLGVDTAFVDSNGNFWLYVYLRYLNYKIENNQEVWSDYTGCEDYYFITKDQTIKLGYKNFSKNFVVDQDTGEIDDATKYDPYVIISNHTLKIPIANDWYYTCSDYADSDLTHSKKYQYKFFLRENLQFIFEVNFDFFDPICNFKICKINNNKFLIFPFPYPDKWDSYDDRLVICTVDAKTKMITDISIQKKTCHNFKFRKLNDLSIFKKSIKKFLKK
mgnify:CR=1 FL=1